jgi:hypothetical protein
MRDIPNNMINCRGYPQTAEWYVRDIPNDMIDNRGYPRAEQYHMRDIRMGTCCLVNAYASGATSICRNKFIQVCIMLLALLCFSFLCLVNSEILRKQVFCSVQYTR